MKTANLIINWLLSDATCHRTERPPSASPFDQIWRQGDKNLNFQTFQWIGENLEMQSRLFKNPNFPSLLWIGKNLEIYTAPDQHFKIPMLNLWMSWENLCPNLSFTLLKIRWGIYIKEDGHISNLTQMIEISHSLKFKEFINELGKIFSTGENEMNPLNW